MTKSPASEHDVHATLPIGDPAPDRNDDVVIDQTGNPAENPPSDDLPEGDPQPGESSSESFNEGDSETSLDDSLVQEAAAYGLSAEELSGLDQQQVTDMLAAIDRRALSMLPQQQQPNPFMQGQQGMPPGGMPQQAWQNPPGAPPQPFQQPFQQSPWPPQQQQPPQVPGFELKLDEDQYDPDLVKQLKGMSDFYNQQMSQIFQSMQTQQSWYEQQMSGLQQQQEAQYTAWFDGKISELGDEFRSVFGKGSGDQLRHNSAEMNNRIRLNDAVGQLSQLYPQATDDELFARALRMEFGQVQAQIQRQQLSQQLKSRSKKTIGKPGRKSKPDQAIEIETGELQHIVDDVQKEIEQKLAESAGA